MISRATSSEKNTAKATTRPNCLKYCPAMPPMKLTGTNTAMMVKRDGDDGEPDLVGGLQRGAVGRFAHAHVAHDVLDLDDGVVDQDAGDDGDGEQADEVEREAGRVERPEGRDDGERQGDGGDDASRASRAGR